MSSSRTLFEECEREHELLSTCCHEEEDVLSRPVHACVLVLHVVEALAVAIIVHALFTSRCDVREFCQASCGEQSQWLYSKERVSLFEAAAMASGGAAASDEALYEPPYPPCLVWPTLAYTLTRDDGSTQRRDSLYLYPNARVVPRVPTPEYLYCELQGAQNDLTCVPLCADASALVLLERELQRSVFLLSLRPNDVASIADVRWDDGIDADGREFSCGAPGANGTVPTINNVTATEYLVCATADTTDAFGACQPFYLDPIFWFGKVVLTMLGIFVFAFVKPCLRCAHVADACAACRWLAHGMLCVVALPVLLLIAVAVVCAVSFIGGNVLVYREIGIAVAISFAGLHLLVVSPIKICTCYACKRKCCGGKDDDEFQMY
mmetsp:Transcript_34076/g.83533  ORF Transcript_34076/g.83533 Transcript_34076/m.83533 type:complete len:379 (+) Transcript_34076:104-1240(+)